MTTIETETIGEAWLETARRILRDGADAVYDGEPTKERKKAYGNPEPELELMAELSA